MKKLSIKKLNVSYGHRPSNKVIKDFSLEVIEGEFTVILGPSGCGKSTLLSAISGLKKPDSGEIIFDKSIFYNGERRIDVPTEMRQVGFVFQSYTLWPHMSVYENIAFPLKVRRLSSHEIDNRVKEILEIVHMKDYMDRYPGHLSGGQKQRIALARALVYKPSLLLLDEPLANLDAHLKSNLIREIKNIHERLGVTTIYVTHDQEEAFDIADRIVVMQDGLIAQVGRPETIYNESKSVFVAEFVGKNNIFKGNKGWPSFIEAQEPCFAVAIRPEDINVCSSGRYKGTLASVYNKGDRMECVIDTGDATLNAYLPKYSGHVRGNEVNFDVLHYHCID